MDNGLEPRSLSLQAVPCLAMLLSALLPIMATAASLTDFSSTESCAERIRVIDDQADLDVREVNQEIARLRAEMATPADTAKSPSREAEMRTELAAAQERKEATLRDQHSVLNDVRAQCEMLRSAARQPGRQS